MKTLPFLTLVMAAFWLCACDNRGNRSGDTSRTPAGTPERIDDGSAADITRKGDPGTSAAPGTNP
ncbi:MAG TPA: hypothetical protein VD994_13665 [Prosthecobacter sp.]|nr:hypothetical protein [Prosthecobacter sp.]